MLKFVSGGYRGGGCLAGSCCLVMTLVALGVGVGLVPVVTAHPLAAGVMVGAAALFFYTLRSR